MADETESTADVTIRVRRGGREPAGLRCSFCGKHQDQVYKIIAGPGVYICSECVELCAEILAADPEGGAVFRVACDGPEGARFLEYGPLPPLFANQAWLDRCRACGTWNAGVGLSACLHCGAELRKQERTGG